MKPAFLVLLVGVGAGCGATSSQAPVPTAKPTVPLAVNALGGIRIPVFPINNIVLQPGSGWDSLLTPRRAAMRKVDSILLAGVQQYGPDVLWVNQDAVRRAAEQAPGMLTNPDQLSTAQLKRYALTTIPEPVRAQLRQLTGVAAGGRYALVPAELVLGRDPANKRAVADFTVILADVRAGAIGWSNTLRGTGLTPWEAVSVAVRLMFP